MTTPTTNSGLEDVVVSSSEICFIDGDRGRLRVSRLRHPRPRRSTPPSRRPRRCSGTAPCRSAPSWSASGRRWRAAAAAPARGPRRSSEPAAQVGLDGRPADRRLGAGYLRPRRRGQLAGGEPAEGRAATAQMPTLVAAWSRIRKGKSPIPIAALAHAANFLYMLRGTRADARRGEGDRRVADPLRRARVQRLTFAARVTSRRSPTCTRASSRAIGALKGPLHGGANEEGDGDAPRDRRTSTGESVDHGRPGPKKRIMGFGHRVYKTGDPRAAHLQPYVASSWARRPASRSGRDVAHHRAGGQRARRTCTRTSTSIRRPTYYSMGIDIPTSTRRSSRCRRVVGVDGAHPGAAGSQPPDPSARRVPGLAPGDLRPARPALTASEIPGCPALGL